MFIAILVDNDERGFQLGGSYNSRWLPIIKALVICYPLVRGGSRLLCSF